MKKSDRIAAIVESLAPQPVPPQEQRDASLDSRYLGYFSLFNQQRYYDAHEVLEDLWLGRRAASDGSDPACTYFKGLIQVAGAYVHLQKQFERPNHPKDGRRLRPASRLFMLAMENLGPYCPVFLGLNVESLHRFCGEQVEAIAGSDYTRNPWSPENAPSLSLT